MCVSAKDYNLTPKQFAFCLEYVKELNGTKAYKEVYKVKDDVARASASRLLANDNVNACIEKLFSEITFDKQAVINQCIKIKMLIASGKATQKRIDTETGKVIEFSATAKDMNDATNDLLKLFGAFETTTSPDEEEDIEALKETSEESKDIVVKGFDDESE